MRPLPRLGGTGDRLPSQQSFSSVPLCSLSPIKSFLSVEPSCHLSVFSCFFIWPSNYDSAVPLSRPPGAHGNYEISCLLQSFGLSLTPNHSLLISRALLFLPRLALSQPHSDKVKLGQGCQFGLLPLFNLALPGVSASLPSNSLPALPSVVLSQLAPESIFQSSICPCEAFAYVAVGAMAVGRRVRAR